MTVAEVLASVRYVTNSKGEKTDVLVPVAVWEALLASWQELIVQIEDQEDAAILQDWLKKRAAGAVETISLDALEQELIEDGLLRTPPFRKRGVLQFTGFRMTDCLRLPRFMKKSRQSC